MATGKRIYINFFMRYIFVIAAISTGAAIFKEVEKAGVKKAKIDVNKAKLSYDKQMDIVRLNFSRTLNVTVDQKMFAMFTEMVRAVEKPTEPTAWTWNDGFHFAFTVMSTIGYGDVVPKTNLGKVLCIIYAIVTIPLFLFALSAAGDLKRFHIEFLLQAFEKKFLQRSEIRHKKKKIVCTTAVLCVIELLIASGISYCIETWTFLDCVYFWAISASTIGFGDLVSDYNNSSGQLLFFNLLFTIIIQAGFAAMFEAITEILSKRNADVANETQVVSCETSAL